jgi:hypothetical protein
MEKAILEREGNFYQLDEGAMEGNGDRHRKTVERKS